MMEAEQDSFEIQVLAAGTNVRAARSESRNLYMQDRKRFILCLRSARFSLDEIGDVANVSRERVRMLLKEYGDPLASPTVGPGPTQAQKIAAIMERGTEEQKASIREMLRRSEQAVDEIARVCGLEQ